jgi:hypothetical protein
MSTSFKASIVAHLVVGGCQGTPAMTGAPFCTQSVEAACADPNAGCLGTWTEAQSDRSVCDAKVAFDEETFECSKYFVLKTIHTDFGSEFLYDKGTGKLVAVVNWGIAPSIPDTCVGGPADLPAPAVNLLSSYNCTKLGDCSSPPDAGSAADGP